MMWVIAGLATIVLFLVRVVKRRSNTVSTESTTVPDQLSLRPAEPPEPPAGRAP